MAKNLIDRKDEILQANRKDIEEATKDGKEKRQFREFFNENYLSF